MDNKDDDFPEAFAGPPIKRRKVKSTTKDSASTFNNDAQDLITVARLHLDITFSPCGRRTGLGRRNERQSASCLVSLDGDGYRSSRTHRYQIQSSEGSALFVVPIPTTVSPQSIRIIDFAAGVAQGSKARASGLKVSSWICYNANFSFGITIAIQSENAKQWPLAVNHLDASLLYGKDPDFVDEIQPWTPKNFYQAVHVPDKQSVVRLPDVKGFTCKLYPFQQRAVTWMLEREGAQTTQRGSSKELKSSTQGNTLPHGFRQVLDANGDPIYVSHLLGIAVTSHRHLLGNTCASIKGGILAEEMGLGKTVEILALIRSHPQSACSVLSSQSKEHDTHIQQAMENDRALQGHTQAFSDLPKCSATLIITPPSILQQWRKEIHAHSPDLKVYVYGGMAQLGSQTQENPEAVSDTTSLPSDTIQSILRSCDVVLTTYNVLSKELYYAQEVPGRSTRSGNLLNPSQNRSPLVRLHWWRVVLDEAQMIENGVSNAAKVARLIPRQNAWAVSGTPVKKDAEDLRGLLIFLRLEPYASSRKIWDLMVGHYPRIFDHIFGTIALRHTKYSIREELTLPPQKRVVVSLPFSNVEEQHYSQMFHKFCSDLGVDVHGQPVPGAQVPKLADGDQLMRTWLTRFRQMCLHPEIGQRNRDALGRRRGLRTMDQLLEVIIEQNETAILAQHRNLLLSRIRRGQILEHAEDSQGALAIWEESRTESERVVRECRQQISTLLSGDDQMSNTGGYSGPSTSDEDESFQLPIYRQRLRSALELEHLCTFFVANAYYQIRTALPNFRNTEAAELHQKETTAYEHAKNLRRELLSESKLKVENCIAATKNTTVPTIDLNQVEQFPSGASIDVEDLCARVDGIVEGLNQQAEMIKEVYEKTSGLLSLPLVDQEDTQDLQGDEYETSTKQQDDLYVHVDIFRTLIADRHAIISGQKNMRIDYEMTKLRKDAKKNLGHSPELLLQLETMRNVRRPAPELGSMRGLLARTRELKATSRGSSDSTILISLSRILHDISRSQGERVKALEKQSEIFTVAMNSRVDYYRQLQHISDTVQPHEKDYSDTERQSELAKLFQKETKIQEKSGNLKSKARYFIHLRDEALAAETGSTRFCIICQSDFDIGVLTVCGHMYCRDCWRLWMKSSRVFCPTCKKALDWYKTNDIRPFSVHASNDTLEEESSSPSSASSGGITTKDGIYTSIESAILNDIRGIDLSKRYGTKIDTLTRHVLWLREQEPGAKSVIFSQYRDFLKVLKKVFLDANIGCTTIDEQNGITKFKHDDGIECFFLHAQAPSSGLNLTEATHVFLCEPLLNTALELQAIARVHRIGQRLPTTVWMYLIEGTVEKAIHDLSEERRLAHMVGVDHERPTVNDEQLEEANSHELQNVAPKSLFSKGKKTSGDEMVAEKDLWRCLFTHCPKRVEEDFGVGQDGNMHVEDDQEMNDFDEATSN